MSKYLLDLGVTDVKCVPFLPSMKAASVLYLALRLMGGDQTSDDVWDKSLVFYTSYTVNQLRPCIQRFSRMLQKAEISKYQVGKCSIN